MTSHDFKILIGAFLAGIAAGAGVGYAIVQVTRGPEPRTRDQYLKRAQEYNLRALRAEA